MRRFELHDGTVHKFWQVDVQQEGKDTCVRVEHGRIGRWSGGTSALVSKSEAEAEVDRLIGRRYDGQLHQRLGQGFVEVEVKTPPPGPVVTHTDGSTLTWTLAALRRLAPIRGSKVVPTPPPDAVADYAELRSVIDMLAPAFDAGEKLPSADVEMTRKVRQAFSSGTPPAVLDLDVQAAAYSLIGRTIWDPGAPVPVVTHEPGCAQALVRFWVAAADPLFPVRARLRSKDFVTSSTETALSLVGKGDVKPPPEWWSSRRRDPEAWRALRFAAAVATDTQYEQMLAEARAALDNATPFMRATLAAVYEHPEWSEGDIAKLAPKTREPTWLVPLLLSSSSIDAVNASVERTAKQLTGKAPTLWGRLAPLLDRAPEGAIPSGVNPTPHDFIARYGRGAVRMFVDLLSQIGKRDFESYHSMLPALASVVSPEVAGFFVKRGPDSKYVREVGEPYVHAHAELAGAAPIPEAAPGKAKARPKKFKVPKNAGELYWVKVKKRAASEIVLGVAVTHPDAMPIEANTGLGLLLLCDGLRSKGTKTLSVNEHKDVLANATNGSWVSAHAGKLLEDVAVEEVDFSHEGVGDQAEVTIRVAAPALLGDLGEGDTFDSTAYSV